MKYILYIIMLCLLGCGSAKQLNVIPNIETKKEMSLNIEQKKFNEAFEKLPDSTKFQSVSIVQDSLTNDITVIENEVSFKKDKSGNIKPVIKNNIKQSPTLPSVPKIKTEKQIEKNKITINDIIISIIIISILIIAFIIYVRTKNDKRLL